MKNLARKILRLLPDEWYIQLQYFYHFHRFANLKNPRLFNEKLQWLKLHDRNPLYTTLVDKYVVKKWVADKIGEQYVIPTLAVWEKAEDIDFDALPEQFVLKVNHDSGGLVICKDKSKLDRQAAVAKLSRALKNNGYWYGREWPYKNVKPCIIAEKYMEDDNHQLNDYKFMVFNGKVHNVRVCSERGSTTGLKITFYDKDWKKLPFKKLHYEPSTKELIQPKNFDEMVALAEKLSKEIPFVRADFYAIDGKTYFGEMTLYPTAGMESFIPFEWDKTLGEWIKLPGGY